MKELDVFSDNLKTLRGLYDMSQNEFSQKTTIARSNLSYYENKKSDPKLSVLLKISEKFNIKLEYLVEKKIDAENILDAQRDKNRVYSEDIFCDRLRNIRLEKGVLQSEVANATGIKKPNISSYEIGKIEPQLSTLIKFKEFFKVTLDDLVSIKIKDYILKENEEISNLEEIRKDNSNDDLFELMDELKEIRENYIAEKKKLEKILNIDIPEKIKRIDKFIYFIKQNI